jgi:hypothetical protein
VRSELGRWVFLASGLGLLLLSVVLLNGAAARASAPAGVDGQPETAVFPKQEAMAISIRLPGPGIDAVPPSFAVDLAYDAIWGRMEPGDTVTVQRTADSCPGRKISSVHGSAGQPE